MPATSRMIYYPLVASDHWANASDNGEQCAWYEFNIIGMMLPIAWMGQNEWGPADSWCEVWKETNEESTIGTLRKYKAGIFQFVSYWQRFQCVFHPSLSLLTWSLFTPFFLVQTLFTPLDAGTCELWLKSSLELLVNETSVLFLHISLGTWFLIFLAEVHYTLLHWDSFFLGWGVKPRFFKMHFYYF